MKDMIATAADRALEHTRAGNPLEATRVLQRALSGSGDAEKTVARPARPTFAGRWRAKAAPTASPAVPTDATFEARRHACAHGTRDYRLFIPSPQDVPAQGLVLMLHGCTQTSDDFATGTRMNLVAERQNLIVAYPQQASSANQMSCWNWFSAEHQGKGAGEPALLADLADTLAAEFGTPAGQIFAAGLSAGGAMAAILGSAYPETFAAVGVHSGLAPGSATDLAGAYAAMAGRPQRQPAVHTPAAPGIVFHGTADTTVRPANADTLIERATAPAARTIIENRVATGATCTVYSDQAGRLLAEDWRVPGMGHAWSGGSADGTYTYPEGPNASEEMIRFFKEVAAAAPGSAM